MDCTGLALNVRVNFAQGLYSWSWIHVIVHTSLFFVEFY